MKEYRVLPLVGVPIRGSVASIQTDVPAATTKIEELVNQEARQGWEVKQVFRWAEVTWVLFERAI